MAQFGNSSIISPLHVITVCVCVFKYIDRFCVGHIKPLHVSFFLSFSPPFFSQSFLSHEEEEQEEQEEQEKKKERKKERKKKKHLSDMTELMITS